MPQTTERTGATAKPAGALALATPFALPAGLATPPLGAALFASPLGFAAGGRGAKANRAGTGADEFRTGRRLRAPHSLAWRRFGGRADATTHKRKNPSTKELQMTSADALNSPRRHDRHNQGDHAQTLVMLLWCVLFSSLIRNWSKTLQDATFEKEGGGGSERPEGASRSKYHDSAS